MAAQAEEGVKVEQRSAFRSVLIVVACTLAMIMNSANNTATTISLSAIGKDLDIQEAQLQWLVSGYSLSSGCLLLVFGRVADLYGRKRVFCLGSVYLAAFTIGCGFAKDATTIEILRGFQGVGAAATIPASLGILAHAFPPSKARAVAFSTFAAGAPVGAALGQVIGGVLTDKTKDTWRSPFYLIFGLIVLCLVIGLVSIDPDVPSSEEDRRIDVVGAFLVTAGLVFIVFVLGQGEIAPQKWRTPYIIALLVVGVALVVVFVFWQRYLERIQDEGRDTRSVLTPPPLMKVSLWARANGQFAATMCIAFLTWCSFLSWTFWTLLYYETFKGYSALQTVVRVVPMFVTGIVCNAVVAFVVGHVPVVYLIVLGTIGTTTACLLFSVIVPSASYWAFGFPAAVLSVFGADFVFSAGTLFIAEISLPHEQSLAGALFQTMTQLGTALGVTATTVVFNRVSQHDSAPGQKPSLRSYQSAQWTAFAFGVLAILLSVLFFRGVGIIGHKNRRDDGGGQTDVEEDIDPKVDK